MKIAAVCLIAAALLGCSKAADAPAGNEVVVEDGAKGVDRSHRGQAAPEAAFIDPDGEQVTLADFAGEPVLVNLWATWCAPCVKELPTLDKLAGRSGPLQVVAISQDMGPQPSVAAFLGKLNLAKLGPYQDSGMKLSGALGAQILPTTILYDSGGTEVWRYTGDLDWTGAEAAKLLAEAAASAPARR